MTRDLPELTDLFARQDGLATLAQLRELGVSEGYRRHRLTSGEWLKVSHNVVATACTPTTWRRRVRAAWLSVGAEAAVSHSTAARMHRFDGFERATELHVTVCGTTHVAAPAGVVVHRSELLDPAVCVMFDGILTVSTPVALLQIAGDDGPVACARALDGVLRDGASPQWIEQVVSRWHRRGVKGPRVVLDLLAQRPRRAPAEGVTA